MKKISAAFTDFFQRKRIAKTRYPSLSCLFYYLFEIFLSKFSSARTEIA